VIVVPGSNALLVPEDVKESAICDTKIVVCQNEIPLNVTREAFRLGRKNSKMTLWNPAPAPQEDCSEVLKFVDILCVNESEARSISGKDEVAECLQVLAATCPIVIITLGKKGCLHLERGKSPVFSPSEVVDKVLDTTGAGDCFCGALALFLSRKAPLELAVRMANHVAAQSVKKYGAQSSFPFLKEVSDEVQALVKSSNL
jgi:ribokinase